MTYNVWWDVKPCLINPQYCQFAVSLDVHRFQSYAIPPVDQSQ